MSTEIIDLTLPAHDPNFPKPRGLLPVPAWAKETVSSEEAQLALDHGIAMAAEAKQRILDDLTLQYYYEGSYVASRRTPDGVEVLAVGWDEVGKFLDEHKRETRQDVRIGMV
jgi:hypothetical protein